ncbi:MAG: hypothetical protein QM654_09895 [Dysgonamonadaceae bacterium]
MKKYLFIIAFLAFVFASCRYRESNICVQNKLPKVILKNVEWGGLAIRNQILPGQTSEQITLCENETYRGVKLPASFPLKFYISVNSDLVYVETVASFHLGIDEDVQIVICDTTRVINPLLEKKMTLRNMLKMEDDGR